MAESSSGEKVFPATERKRKEARRKGQVARSVELSAAFVTSVMLIWLHSSLTSGSIFNSVVSDFRSAFSFDPHPNGFNMLSAEGMLQNSVKWWVQLMSGGLILAFLTAFGVGVAQVGFSFSFEALAPKFEKINPLEGIKRLISRQGLMEALKGAVKILMIGWLAYNVVITDLPLMLSASENSLGVMLSIVGDMIWKIALRVGGLLFVVSVVDYGFQKFEFEKNLKMTHQELKQEMKMAEGDPVIRQRIRQQQKTISQRRMMERIPTATVVITNPTHFAVALRYEKGETTAPMVVAKGQDFIAQQIKRIAKEANVPVVENVQLARKLYKDVEIGREIPPNLYKAVAEVLAFVYRTYKARATAPAQTESPIEPENAA